MENGKPEERLKPKDEPALYNSPPFMMRTLWGPIMTIIYTVQLVITVRARALRNHKLAHNGLNTLPLTKPKDPSNRATITKNYKQLSLK